MTPLMLASKNGHLEVVHILLEYNADVTKVSSMNVNCNSSFQK